VIARSHDGPIEAAVTDVVMPGTTWPELAGRLALIRPQTRVLYVSGYSGEEHGVRQLGPDVWFLRKPFSPSALSGKVRELLEAAQPTGMATRM
jgi:DNA-binding NtrC family response regulator